MDIKEIQELIKFVAKSGVSEVSIDRKDFKITIKAQSNTPTFVNATIPAAPVQALPAAAPAPVASAPAASAPAANNSATSEASNLITIKSPMIGTFYRSSSPDKPAFVNVGDEIKAGKVVCIIEAMKLLNEIESEKAGVIKEILCENGQGVEFDQPLFVIA